MKHKKLVLVSLISAGIAFAVFFAQEKQEEAVHLAVSEGKPFVKIAVPALINSDGSVASGEAPKEIRDTVLGDLAFAWSVELIDPALYKYVPNYSMKDIKGEVWRSLGADAVFLAEIEERKGSVKVEGRLFDTRSGQMIFGKRLKGEPSLKYTIGHTFADEIVYYYTGRKGPFRAPIVYSSSHGTKGRSICTTGYDGRDARCIVPPVQLNLLPVWSPDAKHIVWTSFAGDAPNLWIIDGLGLTKPKRLTTLSMATGGTFSPDGRYIAFTGSDGIGNIDIYVMKADGSDIRRLTYHPAIDTSPAWSATGREIAFTSDRTGSPQIYIMDAEGTNVRRVSWESIYCDAPVWSPDGARLAYVARHEGNFHITALDIASGAEIRLTYEKANHESPSWSPDGSLLTFSSNRTGTYHIYVMRSDGTRVRQVTFEGENTSPSWAQEVP